MPCSSAAETRTDELALSLLSPGGKNKQTTPPNKIQGYGAQQVCSWQKVRGLMSLLGPARRYTHPLQEHLKDIWGSPCDPQRGLGLAQMSPPRHCWDIGGAALQEGCRRAAPFCITGDGPTNVRYAPRLGHLHLSSPLHVTSAYEVLHAAMNLDD